MESILDLIFLFFSEYFQTLVFSGLVTGFMCCAARSGRRENYSTRVVSTPTFHFQPKMATPVGVTGGPDAAHVAAQTEPIQASLSPPSSEDVADNVRQRW